MTGVSYKGKVNAAEQHFQSSLQGFRGGEVIWAMPERKRFFLSEVFPNGQSIIRSIHSVCDYALVGETMYLARDEENIFLL